MSDIPAVVSAPLVSAPLVKEAPHKRYWRENKEKIMAKRALRPKAPPRPLNMEAILKYREIQTQIRALQVESKKYVDEVRLMNRRGEEWAVNMYHVTLLEGQAQAQEED